MSRSKLSCCSNSWRFPRQIWMMTWLVITKLSVSVTLSRAHEWEGGGVQLASALLPQYYQDPPRAFPAQARHNPLYKHWLQPAIIWILVKEYICKCMTNNICPYLSFFLEVYLNPIFFFTIEGKVGIPVWYLLRFVSLLGRFILFVLWPLLLGLAVKNNCKLWVLLKMKRGNPLMRTLALQSSKLDFIV